MNRLKDSDAAFPDAYFYIMIVLTVSEISGVLLMMPYSYGDSSKLTVLMCFSFWTWINGSVFLQPETEGVDPQGYIEKIKLYMSPYWTVCNLLMIFSLLNLWHESEAVQIFKSRE